MGDDDGDDYIASTDHLGLVCVSRHVVEIINSLSGNTGETPPCPPEREINVNDTVLQIKKSGDGICVTEPITIRTITCKEDLCEEGYDYDGDIGPFFDAVADGEDIEYYTEEVINTLVYFRGDMSPDKATTI